MKLRGEGGPTRPRRVITREAWWTVVVIALAAAGIAALWPTDAAPRDAPPAAQVRSGPGEDSRLDGSTLGTTAVMLPADDRSAGP